MYGFGEPAEMQLGPPGHCWVFACVRCLFALLPTPIITRVHCLRLMGLLPSPNGVREGNARTALCTARAPRVRFYQPFPAFFTFFQGGKDAVA